MRAVTLNYGINQKLILITSSEYVFSLPTEAVSFESSWFFLKKERVELHELQCFLMSVCIQPLFITDYIRLYQINNF